MFDDAFQVEIGRLTTNQALIDNLWSEIQAAYTSATRYYHNLDHLDYLVETLLPIRNEIGDWQLLIFSVAYHDIVYDPARHDNEERSAEFAYERLTRLDLSPDRKDKCKRQILTTKHHRVDDNADTNYFTDADLSILGSDNESYLAYTRQIRKEYRDFPDILYEQGRRKVLEYFLEMEMIFKTKYFQDKYETQARINISGELRSLVFA